MTCQLDFKHTSLWCQPCWDSEQLTKQARATTRMADHMETAVRFVEEAAMRASTATQPTPIPLRKPSSPLPKPQGGVDYTWKE